MKALFTSTALLLVASALLAPKAYSQTTVPSPPGTTGNPSANSYNLDLSSVDESYHTVSGTNPGADFYNDHGKHSTVLGMVSDASIVLNFLLKPHDTGGSVFAPGVSADSTLIQRWVWEGPNAPADYQVTYTGSLGAYIHFDGEGSNAYFTGKFNHSEGSHSDSIYGYGSGSTTMNHVASDIYWYRAEGGTIRAMTSLHGEMSGLYNGSSGGSLAGPGVNDGNLTMTSGSSLFFPADQTDDQVALDW